ncbi:MAG TPA: hypothetical protein VF146_06335, partial [Bryobacteraceae bacterium]
FWDNGPFYQRLSNVVVPGIEATPDKIGKTLTVLSGAALAAHLTSTVTRRQFAKGKSDEPAPSAVGDEKGKE